MKTLIRTFAVISLFLVSPAWASHDGHDHSMEMMDMTKDSSPAVPGVEGAACKDTINVKVNGLVCDFCARALEKVFGKRDDVAGIKVDLDKGQVVVATKPGMTIDDATLTKLITDSGYNVTAIDKGC